MTLRILLVDDNATFLAAVKHFLSMLPEVCVVGEAHGGRAALELTTRTQPDLVLLDIAMPGMSGLEVAQALKVFSPSPRIVFLSMHDNAAYRAAARDLGAFGYVGKGDFVTDLLPLIDRMGSAIGEQPQSGGETKSENPGGAIIPFMVNSV